MTDIKQGLSPQQVEESRAKYGHNILTPPKRKSAFRLLLEKFNDPIIKVLLVAAFLSLGISFLHNEYAETIGIFCAIFLATGVAFWFEYDAMKRFDMLSSVDDLGEVKVRRDGNIQLVARKDIVVGDVVLLETGDEIPADGELLQSMSLSVNESTLTGELHTSKTTNTAEFDKDATYPSNMVLRGTTVLEGHGVMVVTAVGDSTEFGKVAREATVESGEKTPLNIQLERLSSFIGRWGGGAAILIFIILAAKDFIWGDLANAPLLDIADNLLKYFMVSVTLIVVAVPEGLPMSVTLSLAINMKRMLKANTLVRRMHACETMGAITVICTDKTGTLTQNIMTVAHTELDDQVSQELINEGIAVNSTANVESGKTIGNPTEGALLLWSESKGANYAQIREQAEVIDQLTFSTERKYMATMVRSTIKPANILYAKGAPEIVMEFCEISSERKKHIENTLTNYQNMGMRTIALTYAECDDQVTKNGCVKAMESIKLNLIGVVAIADPVRTDVPAAMTSCREAGINVKIVTGDTPNTAREIARQSGLWIDETDGPENEITGAEFAAMSDEQLLAIIGKLKIMSRARPLDKQRLVRLLQSQGEVVAVTGDGTNDAPALNFAQVGLAMGSGTSVAKEAGDVTLLDDSFATIATAVMWGRSLYKNIQRFIMFQLTINVVAVLLLFFGSIFGQTLPLTVTQMLWVNIIMDTFAAMALASLPPDKNVMRDRPRKSDQFIITKKMIRIIITTGAIFSAILLGMLGSMGSSATIQQLTILFTVFVMLQFWNMFNAAETGILSYKEWSPLRSPSFIGVLALILIGQILIVNFGDKVFRTVPLSLNQWLFIIASTSLVYIIGRLLRIVKMAR